MKLRHESIHSTVLCHLYSSALYYMALHCRSDWIGLVITTEHRKSESLTTPRTVIHYAALYCTVSVPIIAIAWLCQSYRRTCHSSVTYCDMEKHRQQFFVVASHCLDPPLFLLSKLLVRRVQIKIDRGGCKTWCMSWMG